MESHRILNTMETTSIPIPSLKSHTTNIKRLNDKRILVQEKAFMHQYIMQLHTISFKKEMLLRKMQNVGNPSLITKGALKGC